MDGKGKEMGVKIAKKPPTPKITNRKAENGCNECYEVSVHPKRMSDGGEIGSKSAENGCGRE